MLALRSMSAIRRAQFARSGQLRTQRLHVRQQVFERGVGCLKRVLLHEAMATGHLPGADVAVQ